MLGLFDGEQLANEVELGVMRKARMLLEDGYARIGMNQTSQQRQEPRRGST